MSEICPLRALAYTIAGRTTAEPVCIGERCAWYVKNFGGCAITLLAIREVR